MNATPGEVDLGLALDRAKHGAMSGEELVRFLYDVGDRDFRQAEPFVERCLKDSRPAVRWVALRVLTLKWKLERHQATVERLLFGDPDPEVRAQAASSLGTLLWGSRDTRVLRILLAVLSTRAENWIVRAEAYEALCDICAVPFNKRPPASKEFEEADIDGEFVSELERQLYAVPPSDIKELRLRLQAQRVTVQGLRREQDEGGA